MELHLKIVGWLLVLLSLVHVIFPRYFKWAKEMAVLTLVNRQMMYVHTFFIAVTVFLMGLLCLTATQDLITTPLGKKISIGFCFFWSLRFFIQFFGYSSKLWRGKKFETTVHILFSFLWMYFSVVFLLVSRS